MRDQLAREVSELQETVDVQREKLREVEMANVSLTERQRAEFECHTCELDQLNRQLVSANSEAQIKID